MASVTYLYVSHRAEGCIATSEEGDRSDDKGDGPVTTTGRKTHTVERRVPLSPVQNRITLGGGGDVTL